MRAISKTSFLCWNGEFAYLKKKGNWTVIIIYDDWNNTVFSSSNFTVNWTKPNKASCWMLGIFRFLAHWSTSELSGEKKNETRFIPDHQKYHL